MLLRLCLLLLTFSLSLLGCAVSTHSPDVVVKTTPQPIEVPRPAVVKPVPATKPPAAAPDLPGKTAEKPSTAKPAKVVVETVKPEPPAPLPPTRIIFYREAKFVGSALNYDIYEQSNKRASLQNGSYFMLNVAPGKHSFTVREVSPSLPALGAGTALPKPLILDIKPGETRYVKGGVETGIMSGHPVLIQVSEQEAKNNLSKLLESH